MIVLTGLKGDVTDLAFAPGGRVLTASGGGRGLELWNLPGGEQWGRYEKGIRFADGAPAFHPTENVCLALCGSELAEVETDTRKARPLTIEGVGRYLFNAIAAIPDGTGFIGICNSHYFSTGVLRRFRWARGQLLRTEWTAVMPDRRRQSHLFPRPHALAIGPDGKTVLTLDAPYCRPGFVHRGLRPDVDAERVTTWSAATGEQLQQAQLPKGTRPVFSLAPDGSRFVTAHANALSVWNASDLEAKPKRVKRESRAKVTGLAFHPSGRFLGVACNDKTVALYDATTWDVARVFTWEIGRMRSVAFSPDGTLAAAGSDAGKIVVWDVDV